MPKAPLLGELAPQASERLDKGRLSAKRNNAGAAPYNLSVSHPLDSSPGRGALGKEVTLCGNQIT